MACFDMRLTAVFARMEEGFYSCLVVKLGVCFGVVLAVVLGVSF